MISIIFAWTFKRPIAWIAMLFIALAILCNIVVISVCEGMLTSFVDKATAGSPDFILSHYGSRNGRFQESERYDQDFFETAITVLEKEGGKPLRMLDSIGLAYNPAEDISRKEPVQLRGVDKDNFLSIFEYKEKIEKLNKIYENSGDLIPVIIGKDVSLSLNLHYGENEVNVAMIAPFRLGDHLKKEEIKTVKLKVVDIVDFNNFWNKSIFMSLKNMQEVMNRSGDAAMLSKTYIKFEDTNEKNAHLISEQLNSKLYSLSSYDYGAFQVESWFQNQRWLAQNIMEIRMVEVIILIVLILASCATYLMIHLLMKEKVKTIGLLMALGMSNMRIFTLVISYGFVLSLIGSVVGCVAGHYFMENVTEISIQLLGTAELFSVYGMDGIPQKNFLEVAQYVLPVGLCVSLGIVILCTLSALFPAILASRVSPAEVLKTE